VSPPVSVVVPTYGRADRLDALLRPLLDDPTTLEVVVVVDGCRDGSYERLHAAAADEPRLRPVWRENGGDMAARQTGLEHARGDVVLFLDDDVLATPGLVAGHARAHAGAERLLVLGAMPTPVPPLRRPGDVTTALYAAEYAGACEAYARSGTEVLERLWGGNLSLRRADALEVGLADPGFTATYFADQHFGLRLRAAGFRAEFRPELAAVHQHTRTLRQFRADARRQGLGLHLLHRHHPATRPSPTPQSLSEGLALPAQLLVRLAWSSPLLGATLEAVVLGLCAAAGWSRRWATERRLLLLLRHLGQAVGAARARRSVAAVRVGPTAVGV
jgi:glycosyltransferase involved in cell wall biosynthesis